MKVFSGEDSFESYTNLLEYVNQISSKTNLSIKVLNEDEISIDFFIDRLSSLDIFGENYIYILKRVLNKKDISTFILENINRLKDEDIVIWNDTSLDKRSSLYKKLKDLELINDYPKLTERDFRNWLDKILSKKEFKLTNDAYEYLLLNSLNNKWLITSNIKKLELLDKRDIDLKTISKYINIDSNGDIWKFLEYFSSRKRDKAILEMDKLLTIGDNTQYLISMINREIKILYKVLVVKRENKDIYKYLKISPFQLKLYINKSRNFKEFELKKLIERLFNIDYMIKKGEIEDKLALTLFLLTL